MGKPEQYLFLQTEVRSHKKGWVISFFVNPR